MNHLDKTEVARRAAENVLKDRAVRDAVDLQNEASVLAQQIIQLARETAREMLLESKLDTSAIPLICNKIENIQESIAKIEDNFKWGTRVVIGAVILALMAMIFVTKSPL